METVLAAVLVGALVAVWWMLKPGMSRNEEGRDPWPRSSFGSSPEVPPPALRSGGPTTLFRPEIEGLRAIAVLLVLVYHGEFVALPGGFIGVDVFFVLSGYLVTTLLLRELEGDGGGRVDLPRFYARRIRRLLPAALVTLVVTVVAFREVGNPLHFDAAVDAIRAAALYVSNWYFISESTDYFAADLESSPVLHFWSLSVEEQFYFVWPLLLIGLHRLSRRFGTRRATALRATIGALFRDEKDTREILKWKEVYEHIEKATDRCEDVADQIENILLEYA